MLERFIESKLTRPKLAKQEDETSKKNKALLMFKRFIESIRRSPEIGGNEVEGGAKKEKIFPDGVEDVKWTEYLGGSSGVRAGYFDGELLVMKEARVQISEETGAGKINAEQLREEYLADRIYEAMGFSVPTSELREDGQFKISKFVPGKDLNTFSKDSPEFEKIKTELQKGFVLDCLLANWDVIGTAGGDNIRLGDDGKVYRLDNGGALRFRARGERKESDFGEVVRELDSLRIKNKLFSDISDEEVGRQINEILKHKDDILIALSASAEAINLPYKDLEEVMSIIKKRLKHLRNLRKQERTKGMEKGNYESAVTNNYFFEGWDELELEGNEGIKDTIRENIMRAEKRNEYIYGEFAGRLGISVGEFKIRFQARVEDVVRRSDFFRATHLDALEQVMNVDGRWKNQFETRTSNGTLNPAFRAAQEMRMFGFNKKESSEAIDSTNARFYEWGRKRFPEEVLKKDSEKRPIYGYFSDEEHGAINNQGTIPPPTNVSGYGTINFKIKKERALRKATVTFQDSLDNANDAPPTPVIKPHFTSFEMRGSDKGFLEKFERSSVVSGWGREYEYTEAQYHGQLTMDDVESIHVSIHNGLSQENIEEVRRIFNKYKQQHPESTIQLIEF